MSSPAYAMHRATASAGSTSAVGHERIMSFIPIGPRDAVGDPTRV